MMSYRKLTIDNTILDLPASGFQYSLVYETDADGFISAARAKRYISIPSTSTNDELFQDWYDASGNNLAAAKLKPFTFEDGGVTILAGQAQLQSVPLLSDRYRFGGKEYKIGLYGTNADWTNQLKDTYIRDLDIKSIPYNQLAVYSGWTATYDAGDYSGFTLVKWKEWAIAGQVDIDEFTPFLFIRSIIDLALDSIGYTLQSSFMDSDVFKRLILLTPLPDRYPIEFSQDYINVSLSQPATNTSSISNTYVFPSYTQPNLATPYNTVTGFFTAPYTGYYETYIEATVLSTVGTWSGYFGATVNGAAIDIPNSGVSFGGGVLAPPLSGNASGRALSDVVYLQAGDTISLLHVFGGTDPSTTFEFSMQIRGEAEATFGSIVAFKYLLKDWKVLDMIKGLKHMFNLRFEADPQLQILKIEPADDYLYRQYVGSVTPEEVRTGFYTNNTNDVTQNLDLEAEAELFNVVDIAQTTIFGYETDDITAENMQQGAQLNTYSAKHTHDTDRFNDTVENFVNPFFKQTIHTIESTIQGTSASYPLQIPLIYPNDYQEDPTATEANYDISPRILYFAGYRGITPDSQVVYAFTGGVSLAPPLSFFVNYNYSPDFSLSFSSETVQGTQVTGLLEAFHLQEIARKRIGKTLECRYFWDLITISELTFRDKLYLDGQRWILQKIDGYNAMNDSSTKTVLLLDEYPTADDAAAIVGSGIVGILNLV